MKHKLYYIIGFVIIIIVLGIALFQTLGGRIFLSKKTSDESMDKIFTEKLYKQLVEIDYWFGDTKVVINNQEDMKSFYNNLSSLKSKEPPAKDEQKMGHISIDLVTSNKSISIGLLSNEIIINGKKYYIDKNICDKLREIALRYEDYYKNDIFSKDIFDNLIEIDCWVDKEKLVIDDADSLEGVYHFLSRLSLEEASSDYVVKTDPMQIDMITKNKTISFQIHSNVICTTKKIYYANSPRDLVELITTFAKTNQ